MIGELQLMYKWGKTDLKKLVTRKSNSSPKIKKEL